MRATWDHWWGREMVSVWYHLKHTCIHSEKTLPLFCFWPTNFSVSRPPRHPQLQQLSSSTHKNKLTSCVNILIFSLSLLSVLKHSLFFFFFFFFAWPLLPLPGWQSWVVKHLESELLLLYSRPGQQAHSVQSSPSWQQPYCITMASASVISLCSVLPCFI